MRHLSIILSSLLLFGSCGQEQSSVDGFAAEEASDLVEMQAEPSRAASPTLPAAQMDTTTRQRRIIHSAEYRMQVTDLETASRQAQLLVQRYGGYVAGSETSNSDYELNSRLTLRLPVERFDSVLTELAALSIFTDYRNIRSQDVTEEWLDLETRLQTKRDVRDRYIDILRNRAQTVEDILNAEEKIRVITEEIESQEGRLRFLRDQVALSTIELNLYERLTAPHASSSLHQPFGRRVANAFRGGWSGLVEMLVWLVAIWPVWLLGGAAFVLWRTMKRAQAE